MKISESKLKEFIETFLRVLDANNISSLENIKENLDKKLSINNVDYVLIGKNPSNLGTEAYTLSYCLKDIGVPVETKINEALNYSVVFLKSEEEIKGYGTFIEDPYGNIIQEKRFGGTNFNLVKENLEGILR